MPALAGGERQIMAQGDLEVPLLSSGAGAEQIVYFSSDIERQELNVRMGLAVAQEVARRFRQPLERTAEAALLVVLSEEEIRLSSRLRDEKQNVRLTRAIEVLDELEHQPGNGLDTANLDLLTRALHLSGDSEGARHGTQRNSGGDGAAGDGHTANRPDRDGARPAAGRDPRPGRPAAAEPACDR